jgi:hypothetical protein
MKKFICFLVMALLVGFTTSGSEKETILKKGSTNSNELVSFEKPGFIDLTETLAVAVEIENNYAAHSNSFAIPSMRINGITEGTFSFSNPTIIIADQVFGSGNLLLKARVLILKKLQEGLVNPICWSNDGSFFNFFNETNYAARMTPLYKQMGPITVLKKPIQSSFLTDISGTA